MPSSLSKSTVKRREEARLAASRETRLLGTADTQRFLSQRGWSKLSGISKSSRQSDAQVDRAVLHILNQKLAFGGQFALTDTPPRLVPTRTVSQLSRSKRWTAKFTLARKARHAVTITNDSGARPLCVWHVPHWDHASEVIKTLAYVTSIPKGHRLAFTLRLSDDVANRALRSQKGPAKFLQDRIASAFRKAFPGERPPQFMMALETKGDGWSDTALLGLHVHGVFALPSYAASSSSPQSIMKRAKVALRDARGTLEGPKSARQLHIRSALNPIGWTAYLFKNRLSSALALETAAMLAGKRTSKTDLQIISATNGLRSAARLWYIERRASGDIEWVSRKRPLVKIKR